MENAADALKMAGSLLLFILALSLAILAFSQARETIDVVLKNTDREYLTIEGDSRFYYLANSNDTKRYVGKETIIPTMYRAYKENFKIVFIFPDDYYLFKTKDNNDGIKVLDLSKQSIASDLSSRQFLNGIIYGDFEKNEYKRKFNINPNDMSLYNYLTAKEKSGNYLIKESLGTYYIDDVNGTTQVNDVNKTEKRVITYEFIETTSHE